MRQCQHSVNSVHFVEDLTSFSGAPERRFKKSTTELFLSVQTRQLLSEVIIALTISIAEIYLFARNSLALQSLVISL